MGRFERATPATPCALFRKVFQLRWQTPEKQWLSLTTAVIDPGDQALRPLVLTLKVNQAIHFTPIVARILLKVVCGILFDQSSLKELIQAHNSQEFIHDRAFGGARAPRDR